MSVIRRSQFYGQQRVDAPHLRLLEAGTSGDFDALVGHALAGGVPVVVRGFEFNSSAVGGLAEELVLTTANGVVFHLNATESGSIYRAPADRVPETLDASNPRMSGSFLPNATNYVGLDLVRVLDDASADTVMFLDSAGEQEFPETVDLAEVLDYRIVVSTADFSSAPGICPLAIVVTNASNQVSSLTDARQLMFRLGSGGSFPSSTSSYAWPGGRVETGALAAIGGDRSIHSLKEWMDAVMTRIWESGGGVNWYSPTADRNVRMVATGTAFSNGRHFEWTGSNLHWKGVKFLVDNSPGDLNEVQDQTANSVGLTDLADGECVYVDLDRTEDRTVSGSDPLIAAKGVLQTLGQGPIPGQRWIMAWRTGTSIFLRDEPFALGAAFVTATTTTSGTVKVTSDADSPDPRTALCESATGYLIATGMSRLNSGAGSIFAAGPISIGSGEDEGDQDVKLFTDNEWRTLVRGVQDYAVAGRATLEVDNEHNFNSNDEDRILALKGTDGTDRRTAFSFESIGAMGLRRVALTPVDPAPTAADPIAAKIYLTTNALATPNTRDWLVIQFQHNASPMVIAESDPY